LFTQFGFNEGVMVRYLRLVMTVMLGALLVLSGPVAYSGSHVMPAQGAELVHGHGHGHSHEDDAVHDAGESADAGSQTDSHNPQDHSHEPGNLLVWAIAVLHIPLAVIAVMGDQQREPIDIPPPIRPPRQAVSA
jgi:hypothetical protein